MKTTNGSHQTPIYSVRLESEQTIPLSEAPSYSTWVFVLGIAVAFLFYDALLNLPVFHISEVKAYNLKHLEEAELTDHLQLEKKAFSFFFTPAAEIEKEIKTHPWIKEASIQKVFPNLIEIHVVEHIPKGVALLDQMMAINEEGIPFAPISIEEAGELPILSGVSSRFFSDGGNLYVGQTLLMRGLEVAQAYEESGINQLRSLSDIYIAETGRVELMLNRTRISLGSDQFKKRLKKIKQILIHLKEKSSDAQYILLSEDQNRAIVHEIPLLIDTLNGLSKKR